MQTALKAPATAKIFDLQLHLNVLELQHFIHTHYVEMFGLKLTSKWLKSTLASVFLKLVGARIDSTTTTRRSFGFTKRCLKHTQACHPGYCKTNFVFLLKVLGNETATKLTERICGAQNRQEPSTTRLGLSRRKSSPPATRRFLHAERRNAWRHLKMHGLEGGGGGGGGAGGGWGVGGGGGFPGGGCWRGAWGVLLCLSRWGGL